MYLQEYCRVLQLHTDHYIFTETFTVNKLVVINSKGLNSFG